MNASTAPARSNPGREHRGCRAAYITARCTGCAGSPICARLCRRKAITRIRDDENYPFYVMRVDPDRCSGCGMCITGGDKGIFLTGCPWNAIVMM